MLTDVCKGSLVWTRQHRICSWTVVEVVKFVQSGIILSLIHFVKVVLKLFMQDTIVYAPRQFFRQFNLCKITLHMLLDNCKGSLCKAIVCCLSDS